MRAVLVVDGGSIASCPQTMVLKCHTIKQKIHDFKGTLTNCSKHQDIWSIDQWIDHGHTYDWDEEDKDSQDVGDTGVEGLNAFPGRGQPQDCAQDESIGQDNEQGVYARGGHNHIKPIEDVYGDVSTGPSHHIRMEAE